MLSVSVSKCDSDKKNEDPEDVTPLSYALQFKWGDFNWMTKQPFTEVAKAKAALDDKNGPSDLPDLVNDARSIEEYFSALFFKLKDDVWNEEALRMCLDSNNSNVGTYMLIKFQKMAEKLEFLQLMVDAQQHKIKELISTTDSLKVEIRNSKVTGVAPAAPVAMSAAAPVNTLTSAMTAGDFKHSVVAAVDFPMVGGPSRVTSLTPSSELGALDDMFCSATLGDSAVVGGSPPALSAASPVTGGDSVRFEFGKEFDFGSVSLSDLGSGLSGNALPWTTAGSGMGVGNVDKGGNGGQDGGSSIIEASLFDHFLDKKDGHAAPALELSIATDHSLDPDTFSPLSEVKHAKLPFSLSIPDELYPTAAALVSFEPVIDSLLLMMQSHESQREYRYSAAAILKKQIRVALGSSAFETDLQSVFVLLPDDHLKLSVVTNNPVTMGSFHMALSEHLHSISNTAKFYFPANEEEETTWRLLDETPITEHIISMVAYRQRIDEQFDVLCRIDSIEVEITLNNNKELCFLAFLEEMSKLVGQEHLFKRSLLLIRAWWIYEGAVVCEGSIKHYLPDSALCMMVCAIFNQYHTHINSPLQALSVFLMEYANFDGSVSAITLQGIIKLDPNGSGIADLTRKSVSRGHLVTESIISNYGELFSAASKVPFVRPKVAESGAPPPSATAAADAASKKRRPHLECGSFTILHPFEPSNMVVESISPRKVAKLTKLIDSGLAQLGGLLQKCKDDKWQSGATIKEMFPTIVSRFADSWRPDALGNSIQSAAVYDIFKGPQGNGSQVMELAAEKNWQGILYCNFLFNSMISETAVLRASIEILAMRGPVPVGDLAKALSDVSCTLNLVLRLKEKFGGLKTFLVSFPEVFVLSNDHPYSPHVMLRAAIPAEYQEGIDRGVIPTHLIKGSKKAMAAVAQIHQAAPPPLPPQPPPPPPYRSSGVQQQQQLYQQPQYGTQQFSGQRMQQQYNKGNGYVAQRVGPPQPPQYQQQSHYQQQSQLYQQPQYQQPQQQYGRNNSVGASNGYPPAHHASQLRSYVSDNISLGSGGSQNSTGYRKHQPSGAYIQPQHHQHGARNNNSNYAPPQHQQQYNNQQQYHQPQQQQYNNQQQYNGHHQQQQQQQYNISGLSNSSSNSGTGGGLNSMLSYLKENTTGGVDDQNSFGGRG